MRAGFYEAFRPGISFFRLLSHRLVFSAAQFVFSRVNRNIHYTLHIYHILLFI